MHLRRVGIIDLVHNDPYRLSVLGRRLVDGNQASIMPQAIGVWCEQMGHAVEYTCYPDSPRTLVDMAARLDIVFISSFTRSAQLAYAISHLMRARGVVTVIGGPHARCYPQDSRRYFDYVLGFTDKTLIGEVLQECAAHRPLGVRLSIERQPDDLPGIRDRWKFQTAVFSGRPLVKMVHMLGSLGCPYTCSFCMDADVPYQTLSYESLRDDLRFLRTKFERPLVQWDDPNFGVRFDEYMSCIEDAVPPDSVSFICHISLSVLKKERLARLRKNGFKVVMPGIESWYDMANKSQTGARRAAAKMEHVAEHVNEILRYIPFVQTNFILGLDTDEGPEPFALTREFSERAPGAFPYLTLLTCFGRSAAVNLDYQRDGRVLPFPFHFLNNSDVSNVRLRHFAWPQFFDHTIELRRHLFSTRAIARRFAGASRSHSEWLRWMHLWRAIVSERRKLSRYIAVRRLLETDSHVRRYWDGDSTDLPAFYRKWIRRDLGPMWEFLPEGALHHDQNEYLAEYGMVSTIDPPMRVVAGVRPPAGARRTSERAASVGLPRHERSAGANAHEH